MMRFLSKMLFLIWPMRVFIAHETHSTIESSLMLVRTARSAILRDHFNGVHSVAVGLWMNDCGRLVLVKKLRDARLNNRSFVVAFGGTSITAGHDNYLNQTYPEVFRRLAAEPFANAGINLTVRNVAHGANPHLPYSACVAAFYGIDADVVSIEMKVMSKAKATSRSHAANHKGGLRKERRGSHESSEAREGADADAAPNEVKASLSGTSPSATSRQDLARWSSPAGMAEVLIRFALQLPSRPLVLFVDGVYGRYGGPRQKKLVGRTQAPPSNWPHLDSTVAFNHANPAHAQSLLSHYRDYGLQRLDLGVATWFVDHFHNAAELATYVASNGSSTNKTPIFPGSPPVTPSQSLATKDARARPQAHDLASQPNPFSWAALNHGKAFEHIGWHPGPGHHALRGAVLADNYLAALETVLQEELNTINNVHLEDQRASPKPTSSLHLPPPLLCAPWLCTVAPHCASTYIPRAPGDASSLGHLVHTDLSIPNLHSPEPLDIDGQSTTAKGARIRTDGNVVPGGTARIEHDSQSSSRWRHLLFSKTLSAVRRASEQHRGYLDRKYVLQSPPGSTAEVQNSDRFRLTLRLPHSHSTNTARTSPQYNFPGRSGDDGSASLAPVNDTSNSDDVRQFISLCFPWTGQYPPSWLPISPTSVRIRIDGVLVTNRSNTLRFAATDEAAPMSDGPCATIFIGSSHSTGGTSEEGSSQRHTEWRTDYSRSFRRRQRDSSTSTRNQDYRGSSNRNVYTVDIEPATPHKQITLSHVLWR